MSRRRRHLQRLLTVLAAVPVAAALMLGLLIITAASTAPDLAPPEVSGLVETAPPPVPSAAPSTTSTTAPPVTEPPPTAPIEPLSPTPTDPPVTDPPATAPPPSSGAPGSVTVRVRYDEPSCGAATTSATGCVRSAAAIDVSTSSGAGTGIGPPRSVGSGVWELVTTLQVRTVATEWEIRVRLDYVGPCGPAPVDAVRYHVVVSPDGDVRLFGVNGSTGSLRRPQPNDPAWVASVQPIRFPPPEPGCA